jgi:DNA polymerase-1
LKRTLLIDGDLIAYRLSAAVQRTYELPEGGKPVVVARPEEAQAGIEQDIDKLVDQLKADRVIVCLSDDFESYRKRLLPSYKAHRAKLQRPVLLYDMKDWLAERYEFDRRPGLEADDVMGILATQETPDERRCIVSIDKDMAGVPGWLFNPHRDNKPRRISEIDADRWFLRQTLTGDPVDGYKGCPGVGPRSAYVAAINEAEDRATMWSVVLEAYEAKGLTPDDALVQARMAYILRAENYDADLKRVRLWEPPAA